jgi:predicted transcriptional regulator
MKKMHGTSDGAVLEMIGERIKQERLNQNLTQVSLAQKGGISVIVIQRLEGGRGCTLENLIRTLRSLNKLDQLDLFLPEPGVSPIELARLAGRQRKEATGGRGRPPKVSVQ